MNLNGISDAFQGIGQAGGGLDAIKNGVGLVKNDAHLRILAKNFLPLVPGGEGAMLAMTCSETGYRSIRDAKGQFENSGKMAGTAYKPFSV